jgi:Patatin-like phospholipase
MAKPWAQVKESHFKQDTAGLVMGTHPDVAERPEVDAAESAKPAAFATECDLVMKGGITSGIVYPLAIVEIAKAFRLRSIGGTSAGAITSSGGRAPAGPRRF